MSKTLKTVLFGIFGLVVAGVLGYGIYSYATHTGYFAPAETEVTETVEEVEISE